MSGERCRGAFRERRGGLRRSVYATRERHWTRQPARSSAANSASDEGLGCGLRQRRMVERRKTMTLTAQSANGTSMKTASAFLGRLRGLRVTGRWVAIRKAVERFEERAGALVVGFMAVADDPRELTFDVRERRRAGR